MGELADRIVIDPDVLVGKPVVSGTRLSVEFVLDLLVAGWSGADIARDYPQLEPGDVVACLRYAREVVSETRVYPTAA